MQLIPRYLYNNKMVLVSNLAGANTEFKQVYTRNIKLHRGIDNTILFEIKNADQKPLSILNTYTPKFTMFDENNTQVLSKVGTIKETSTPLYKGQFTVDITENELANLKDQYLKYNVYLTKTDGSNMLTYSDSQFGMSGTIELHSEAFPGPKDSYTVQTFTETSTDNFTSETINAEPALNGNVALHTAAVYGTNFIGDFTVQGTLANQGTGTTNWFHVDTVTFTGSETEPKPINFNGVFNYLRFKYSKTSGTIDKVLVRN